ncbi:DUF2059 domain-containing protein [Marinobacter confluentis]|uniref:DUF2059 domain-containing protein n=1 Tax=Marinobacter confluentis TaxID=1697557 RepID=A0A4Z1BD42_9GAMM|nr:DUF2059 domain-containing protein [Marinobacter confluentis]TGN40164.1 DUF2059 domain-containing protein [Marinobacter confluentis]
MPALSQIKPLLVCLLLLPGFAHASPLAKSVLEASPVDDIVAQYPAMMTEGVRQGLRQSGQSDPMVVTTVTAVVRNAFRAADMQSALVSDLSSEMNEDQLKTVGRWYETPLAQKVSQAEIAASSPDVWPRIERGAPDMQARFKGSDRAALFTRYDRAARATESAVDTTVAVQLGLATAISAFQGSNGPGFDRLKQMIEGNRDQVRAMVAQQVYDAYLYTYQDLTVDELKDYIGFLESDAGARFTRVVTGSIQDSITQPVEAVGRQLTRFLGSS